MKQTTTVVNEIDISISPEMVFDLVSSPGLWPRWHPSSRHLAPGADRPLKKGEGFSEEIKAGGRKGKLHQLRVYYSADSIAVAYAIRYRYSNFLFAKEYVLDSNDIR